MTKRHWSAELIVRRAAFALFAVFVATVVSVAQDDLLPPSAKSLGNVNWVNNDYYEVEKSAQLRSLLTNVHGGHYSKHNFWSKFDKQQWDFALNDLKYITWVFPNHPEALMLLGSVAKLTRSPSLPLPYYKRALTLFPQHAFTHYQYGDYLLEIDLVDEAISSLNQAVALDPELASAYAALSKAYSKKGNSDLAARHAKRARELGYKEEILEFSPTRKTPSRPLN